MRPWLLILMLMLSGTVAQGEGKPPPQGMIGADKECMACHVRQTADWQASAHARKQPVAGCIACHGGQHGEMASRARRDQACTACHGGKEGAVAHSYASSKHGVLMRLEESRYDWKKPLEMANYRAPGCAYCHLHQGNHNVGGLVRDSALDKAQAMPEDMSIACRNCHAPRYVARLFENGETMLEIGRKKMREAEALARQAEPELDSEYQAKIQKQLQTMRAHLQNVRLGAGHQSPDYQWWHGQPALDGDLLRIRGLIDEYRMRGR